MIKLKNLHKQNLTEALGSGGPMYSDIVGNYGSVKTIQMNTSESGSTTFEAGQSKINAEAKSIKKIVDRIRKLLKQTKFVQVVVSASASSLGQKSGFNNQALAELRQNEMIKFLTKEFGAEIETQRGTATVSKKEYPNPADYEQDQNISVVINYLADVPYTVNWEIDNTDTYRPDFFKTDRLRKGGDDTYDTFEYIKRICVQIPESYVDQYISVIKKFRRDHKLSDIPWAVYKTGKKIKVPGFMDTFDPDKKV